MGLTPAGTARLYPPPPVLSSRCRLGLSLMSGIKITVNLDLCIDIYGKSCYSVTVIKNHTPNRHGWTATGTRGAGTPG